MSRLRLDKLVSESGVTRSEAKKLILSGRVSVDGIIETRADLKVDTEISEICIDGRTISTDRFHYFMLYKPQGVLSATEDRTQKTVLSLLPPKLQRLGLFPVGRLDKDTTGLIILTDDGEFCHMVTSPKKHVQKLYEFRAEGALEVEDAAEFSKGIILRDGTKCLPASLEIDNTDPYHGYITIYEGKYHQVKRMLAARGKPVTELKRVAIGGLCLQSTMRPGDYIELCRTDLEGLLDNDI